MINITQKAHRNRLCVCFYCNVLLKAKSIGIFDEEVKACFELF